VIVQSHNNSLLYNQVGLHLRANFYSIRLWQFYLRVPKTLIPKLIMFPLRSQYSENSSPMSIARIKKMYVRVNAYILKYLFLMGERRSS